MTIKGASTGRGKKTMKSAMDFPSPTPPPPPTPSAPSSASKINRKTMVVLVVIAIIVVAAVVGVLLATRGGGGSGGGSGGTSVAGASSLQFNADIAVNATTTYKYTYYAKNIGTSNAMVRVEISDGISMIEIVNEAQQQAWVCENGAWTNATGSFSNYWSAINSGFASTKSELSNWSGSGSYTYTDPTTGYSIRFYNIVVNPSLPDSLFEHS